MFLIFSGCEKRILVSGVRRVRRRHNPLSLSKNLKHGPPSGNTMGLRFKRITFGVVCSPFLLGAVIKRHLDGCAAENWTSHGRHVDPQENALAVEINDNLYLDNAIVGAETETEANKNVNEQKTFRNALDEPTCVPYQFRMRQWEYSCDR